MNNLPKNNRIGPVKDQLDNEAHAEEITENINKASSDITKNISEKSNITNDMDDIPLVPDTNEKVLRSPEKLAKTHHEDMDLTESTIIEPENSQNIPQNIEETVMINVETTDKTENVEENLEEDKNFDKTVEDADKNEGKEMQVSVDTEIMDISVSEMDQSITSNEPADNVESISETSEKEKDDFQKNLLGQKQQSEELSTSMETRTNSIESNTDTTSETTKDSEKTDSFSTSSFEQEKEKNSDGQRKNTEFVQVNTESEKDGEDNEKDDDTNNRTFLEHDPIASDSFEPMISEDQKLPRQYHHCGDISASQSETNSCLLSTDQDVGSSIIVFKYDKEDLQICNECKLKRKVKYYYTTNDTTKFLCDDNCLNAMKNSQDDRVAFNWEEGSLRVKNFSGSIKEPPSLTFIRKCAACKKVTDDIENNLTWEIMDFCNEFCLSKYQKEIGSHCSSCQGEVKSNSLGKYCVRFGNDIRQFCTSMCLEKYKKGLKVCSYCQQDMSGGPEGFLAPVGDKGQFKDFCSQLCMEKYDIMTNDRPPKVASGTICSNQFPKQPITLNSLGDSGCPVPTGGPKKNKKHPGGAEISSPISDGPPPLPIISSVQSLASTNGSLSPTTVPPSLTPINTRSTRSKTNANTTPPIINSTPQIINSFADLPVQVKIKQHFIVRPAPVPDQRNVGTMCYTRKANKGTTAKPVMVDEGVQTEERGGLEDSNPCACTYLCTDAYAYVHHTCTDSSTVSCTDPHSYLHYPPQETLLLKIQVKIPTDPYEAELLMMAEMVAEEKKDEVTDSESDVDDTGAPEDSYSPEPVDASNTFGDDMLQMALKMATELDEPAVDLEGALTANTITAPQGSEAHQEENVDDPQPMHPHIMERTPSMRGRKRGMRQSRGGNAKRGRRMSHQQVEIPDDAATASSGSTSIIIMFKTTQTLTDIFILLQYTFGVNAWKQWVTTKNTELEKSSMTYERPIKLFKTEILQLTADELNYSLCLFVKEQYLFENGRIDNIFCDPYYEKFTDCLDEVAKKFSVLYNDSHYIVTRVEEEHLWESKQLGAHSPHVLLSTLMFFNTKHFNLTSVDEHMQLSFSHIMKHWKRNPNQPSASKAPGSRNVLLRFYPPQSAIQNNTRKKKVYEQEQNEENPLRCPVKLYEFYLSKCPESVKTRNDVFYLQPERSCVPDSPVWYSTMHLPRDALEKMLHRVKMVKEINVALLTS
ncbi:hypothetical protein NQ317_018727 [Molorchus minor]|uniref:TRASH domain-containing protein n=1 Tax=Molorchus minor TaxID=1323400 RepID=A0ABQ9JQN6_9CUCU|nr:hypothetical protein NQ317_018727 [Molorchus minor]